MNDRRKIEILRVALDAIAFEAKEPAMRVYAQSALDQTKDLPKEQEQNSHCEKHSWYGLPDEKCPICEPYAKTPVSGSLPLSELQKEYQKLIEDEYEETVRFASIHGWKSSRHEKGKELRDKIKELEAELDAVKNNLVKPDDSGTLPCYHNYIQKDTWWKSCTHCGMIAPLGQ